jgi:hypothetical protein
MSDDADDLASAQAAVRKAEAKLTSLRAQEQSWRNKLLAASQAGCGAKRSQPQHNLNATIDRIAAVEKTLKALRVRLAAAESRETEDILRNHDETFPSTPPHAGWEMRCFRTLTINGKVYGRGSQISPEELAQCLNASTLLSGGHVRWQPPSAPKKAAPPPTLQPDVSAPPVPDDPVAVWRREVKRIAAQRGIAPRLAVDLAPGNLTERAFKADADKPKVVNDGSLGSGGGSPQRSGVGTLRRITSGAIDRMLAEPPEAA